MENYFFHVSVRKIIGPTIGKHHPENFVNGNRDDDYKLELYVGLLQKQKNMLVVQPSPPIINKIGLVFEYKYFFLSYMTLLS